jgi:hypothetical protein
MAKHFLFFAGTAFLIGCSRPASVESSKSGSAHEDTHVNVSSLFPPVHYPDFRFDPSESGYLGKLFKLNRDYPTTQPDDVRRDVSQVSDPTLRNEISELQPILGIPFDTGEEWRRYLLRVRDYCLKGASFERARLTLNPARNWYHAPWLHGDTNAREGLSGMTKEATAKIHQLHPNQEHEVDTFAIAYYNTYGGYTLGQVWPANSKPEPSRAQFPVGTVIFKLLFTQANEREVPFLKNPIEIEAFVTPDAYEKEAAEKANKPEPPRAIRKVRLLQMDVMVRDDRGTAPSPGRPIDHVGWVFGAFCYNGASDKQNKWENLVPIGLSWGDDPQETSKATNEHPDDLGNKTVFNSNLKQTRINHDTALPAQHLGRAGRLNGPLDFYKSSCISCHSTAQYRTLAPMHPDFDKGFRGSDEMAWFQNVACRKAFGVPGRSTPNTVSLDYSLQLAIGLRNCDTWRGLGGLPSIGKAQRKIADSLGVPGSRNRMPMILSDARRGVAVMNKGMKESAELEIFSNQANDPERECSLNLAEINK